MGTQPAGAGAGGTGMASRRAGRLTRRTAVLGAAGTVGVAGVVGGLVAGAGMFAGAATVTPTYSSELSQCAAPSAPVPGTPVYTNRFVAGGTTVSGTIPAIPAATLTKLGITPTLVNVSVTTQYNSGRSGAGKTDVATVTLPGHQYTNPLLFDIPPVTSSEVVGTGTVAYSARTTGVAYATVTVTETIVAATSLTPELVLGSTCPTGPAGLPLTKVGTLSGQAFQPPAAPTAVSVTAGGTVAAGTTSTAPRNGAVTVKFTPSANNGTQPSLYQVYAQDTTNPSGSGVFGGVVAPTDATSTAQLTAVASGLNTNDSYVFQVYAVAVTGASGPASTATTPAIKPAVQTVAAAGSVASTSAAAYRAALAAVSSK